MDRRLGGVEENPRIHRREGEMVAVITLRAR